MEQANLWDNLTTFRTLYSMCIEPVRQRFDITRAELDIILFLANNPNYDTAAQIADVRHLAKSQVSMSLKTLEENGYVETIKNKEDKRKVHLRLTEKAFPIVKEGRIEQSNFRKILFKDMSEEEQSILSSYLNKMEKNMNEYLAENS